MKPKLRPVDDSTAIAALGYDDDAQELYVQWASGDIYVYLGVPPLVFRILLNDKSKGSYLNKMIKPHYRFRDG